MEIKAESAYDFMKTKQKSSKIMFFAGIGIVVISAILLLGNFMSNSTFPTVLGILGVGLIAASNFRLLK